MPELPEVEILRRNVDRWWTGRVVRAVAVPDPALIRLDIDSPAPELAMRALVGQTVERAWRRAKWLVIELERHALLCHFRMTGKLVRATAGAVDAWAAAPVGRVGFLVGGDARPDTAIWFKDTRRLGELTLTTRDTARRWADAGTIDGRDIGPEPWPTPVSGPALAERTALLRARARTPLAVRDLLLDERFVAGVGNITACEALFAAGVHPATPARAVTTSAWTRIAEAIADHVERTLDAEDGDEVAYVNEPGSANPFRVYGRAGEPCPRCAVPLVRSVIRQRAAFWCGACQRRDAG